jgi:MFS family permease
MTGDRDPIQQYLDELRLSLRIPEVGRILVEAEDHLRAATAAGMAEGLTEAEAQQAAIAGFGPVREIVYAHQTRHGRVAAVLADLAIALWRVAAFYLLAAFLLGLGGLLGSGFGCPARATLAASCKLPTLVPETSALAALISWAATGIAGLALLAAYFAVRRVQRRRGRVWSVPLGGYFPLAAIVASVAVGVGLLLLDTTTHVAFGPWSAIIIFAALGLVVTYGLRMWRMLWNQARGRGELV